MEEVKKVDALEKAKSQAQLKFEAFKHEAIELEKQALSIVIKDETTLAMCNQVLSKINALVKGVKAKGLELRKPFNDVATDISRVEKLVTVPLDNGLTYGKAQIRLWNEAVAAQAEAKKAALAKKKEYLDKIVRQLTEKADKSKTPEECQKLIDSIGLNFPAFETFAPYDAEASEVKRRFISVLQIKKEALKAAFNGDAGSTEAIVKMQQAEVAVKLANIEAEEKAQEKQADLEEAINDTSLKSNVRKTAKAVVVDVNLLPKEWLMPDMDKINAHLKSIKGTIEFPYVYNGVKFYYDESPIIK